MGERRGAALAARRSNAMTVSLFTPHILHWHPHLPEWHPHWPRFNRPGVSHWPHENETDASKPPTGFALWSIHGCLVLCNVVWSSLHILMAVPLRKARKRALNVMPCWRAHAQPEQPDASGRTQGASPAVLSFLREVIGFAALAALALTLDKGKRPPLTRRLVTLFGVAGALSALIRITIIAALQHAGPDVTAGAALPHALRCTREELTRVHTAITPATPVITLLATLALGMATLRVHAPSGQLQVAGLALCSLSACAMGLAKGPVLFGTPPTGANAPNDVPLGALFMLFNCVLSAIVQARLRALRSLACMLLRAECRCGVVPTRL